MKIHCDERISLAVFCAFIQNAKEPQFRVQIKCYCCVQLRIERAQQRSALSRPIKLVA